MSSIINSSNASSSDSSSSSSSGSDSDIPIHEAPPLPALKSTLLPAPPTSITAAATTCIDILILGGNGCIGSEIVHQLCTSSMSQNVHLTLLNRGRKYWSECPLATPSNVSKISFLQVDRTHQENIQQALQSRYPRGSVDIVIDCSGYRRRAIRYVLESVAVKRQYIYVSSDSIYEVCSVAAAAVNSTSATMEEECIRPQDANLRHQLSSQDQYGHKKKQCEEYLTHLCKTNVLPSCTLLRLADVIGPRDNTDRLWHYVMWLRYCHVTQQDVPAATTSSKPLSFTFSIDVARLIVAMVSNPNGLPLHPASNNGLVCYNVASPETPTHAMFVKEIALCMGLMSKTHREDEESGTHALMSSTTSSMANPSASSLASSTTSSSTTSPSTSAATSISYYPSTSRGPININKVQQENAKWWTPTPLREAIQCSVRFLEHSMQQGWNQNDCMDVIISLASDLGLKKSKHQRRLVESLTNSYGEQMIRKYPWKKKKKKKKKKN